MRLAKRTTRFGLTVMELMLALSITVIVGAALTAMLRAIWVGVETDRDTRSHLLHANAAQMRLSAYIAPSLCILHADRTSLTLWFNDARRGGTVNLTEIRWLRFNDATGTIVAYMVNFPDSWTETEKLLEDREYSPTTNWDSLLNRCQNNGWITSIALVDGLDSVEISRDHDDPQDSRHVTYRLVTSDAKVMTLVSSSLRVHRKPK